MEGAQGPGGGGVTPRSQRSPLYPILFMVALAAAFGAAVSAVAVATRERVEAGARARVRAHVLTAFGIPVPQDAAAIDALWGRQLEERDSSAGPYYAARDTAGAPLGYGFPFSGPGFWGPIRGVVAVTPDGGRILGLSFTSHQETPGLGGRISEEWFQAQFRDKTLAPAAGGGPLLQFVYRPAAAEREIEAITGATQTSSRLDQFLNEFLPGLRGHPAFTGAGGAG